MMAGRYAHAKQFNRHRRQLRVLRTRLGRLIRDIRRKIAGYADLVMAINIARSCSLASCFPAQCSGRPADVLAVTTGPRRHSCRTAAGGFPSRKPPVANIVFPFLVASGANTASKKKPGCGVPGLL